MRFFCEEDSCKGRKFSLRYVEAKKEYACLCCGSDKKQPCFTCGELHDKSQMTFQGVTEGKVYVGGKSFGEDDGMYWRSIKAYECHSCSSKGQKSTKKGTPKIENDHVVSKKNCAVRKLKMTGTILEARLETAAEGCCTLGEIVTNIFGEISDKHYHELAEKTVESMVKFKHKMPWKKSIAEEEKSHTHCENNSCTTCDGFLKKLRANNILV